MKAPNTPLLQTHPQSPKNQLKFKLAHGFTLHTATRSSSAHSPSRYGFGFFFFPPFLPVKAPCLTRCGYRRADRLQAVTALSRCLSPFPPKTETWPFCPFLFSLQIYRARKQTPSNPLFLFWTNSIFKRAAPGASQAPQAGMGCRPVPPEAGTGRTGGKPTPAPGRDDPAPGTRSTRRGGTLGSIGADGAAHGAAPAELVIYSLLLNFEQIASPGARDIFGEFPGSVTHPGLISSFFRCWRLRRAVAAGGGSPPRVAIPKTPPPAGLPPPPPSCHRRDRGRAFPSQPPSAAPHRPQKHRGGGGRCYLTKTSKFLAGPPRWRKARQAQLAQKLPERLISQ